MKSEDMTEKRAVQKFRKCNVCKKSGAIKRTAGKCKKCAIDKGFKVCTCGRIFKPKKRGQRSCGTHVGKTKSVWISASSGLPTLGKRK